MTGARGDADVPDETKVFLSCDELVLVGGRISVLHAAESVHELNDHVPGVESRELVSVERETGARFEPHAARGGVVGDCVAARLVDQHSEWLNRGLHFAIGPVVFDDPL